MEYKTRKQAVLETLKVGDDVVIEEHNHGRIARESTFATVTKVTKTQLTMSNGKRYLISDGEELGTKSDGWRRYGTYISFWKEWSDEPLTLTTRAQAEEQNAKITEERDLRTKRVKLNNAFSSLTLSVEQVEEIARIAGFDL